MKPGFYKGMSFEEYQKISAINVSGLKLFDKSAAHYYSAYLDTKREIKEPTSAMKLGTAIHAAILEPKEFMKNYACSPEVDRRTKIGKEIWEEFVSKNPGKQYLTFEETQKCLKIAENAYKNQTIKALCEKGSVEVVMIWEDPDWKVICKARADYITEDGSHIILDYKSVEDASPKEFARKVATYEWHLQDAFYSKGYSILTGENPSFIFGALEKTTPFAAAFYTLDQKSKELGAVEIARLMQIYELSFKAKSWPSYSSQIETISLPAWRFKNVDQSPTTDENEANEALPY